MHIIHLLTLDVVLLGSLDEVILVSFRHLAFAANLASFQKLGDVIDITQPLFPPHVCH